jgi:hypothetical protein
MAQDLFHSRYSRNELAEFFSDYFRDIHGYRPEIADTEGRAALVSRIEELDEYVAHQGGYIPA